MPSNPLPETPPREFTGFWCVPPGFLIEVGDSYLDETGAPHSFPLERVGQTITGEVVVLRVERRRAPR